MANRSVPYNVVIGQFGSYHATDEQIPGIVIASFNVDVPCRTLSRRFENARRRVQIGDATYILRKHDYPIDHSPALPLQFMEQMELPLTEHGAIMQPAPECGEGIFAIAEHLGEGQRVESRFCEIPGKLYGLLLGQRLLPKEGGLTNLEKIIYYEAGMTAQGEAVLPHEVRSRRAWHLHPGGIARRLKCNAQQAQRLCEAWRVLDTTPKMARQFEQWITPANIDKAILRFEELAIGCVQVTDEGEPELDMIAYEEGVDPNRPRRREEDESTDEQAAEPTIQAEGWHRLDDPRDVEGSPEAERWEDKQPFAYRAIIHKIRAAADLKALGAIGKSLYGKQPWNKVQIAVAWDEYHRRKSALTPKLRKTALVVLERLADPKVNLGRAAQWLHTEGKKLQPHESAVLWNAWKAAKKARAPKQSEMPPEPPPIGE